MHDLMAAPWRIACPTDAVGWLAEVNLTWWIAGGWAVDLFLGGITRPHKDLDVGIFRRDAPSFISSLRGWEIFEAKDRTLKRLREGATPHTTVNSLWCRQEDSADWSLELLLDDRTDEHWVFRRHREIMKSAATILKRNAEGLAYLSPEIQMLYKAKALRPHDQRDFERVLPHLEFDAAEWLRNSLEVAHPKHPWISQVDESLRRSRTDDAVRSNPKEATS